MASVSRRAVLAALLCGIFGSAGAQPGPARPAAVVQVPGGSNYIVYGLEGCDRTNFEVVPSYPAQKPIIDRQLRAMFDAGQRRLRISLPVSHLPQSAGMMEGVSALLETIRQSGFQEILAVIGGGQPAPHTWKSWDEAAYQQRWDHIVAYRKLLVASGLRYHLDLLNEGIPARNQPILLQYTRRLWADYTAAFGVADTLGFSIIPDPRQDRFAQLQAVYGPNPPRVFDIHFYAEAGSAFVNAHRRLVELGYGHVPWIVGESFYDDGQEAAELANAIESTGQRVLFLLQWPLTSRKRCSDIDVAVPSSFSAYRAAGF